MSVKITDLTMSILVFEKVIGSFVIPTFLSLSSKFPDRWEESHVVLYFKSGSRFDVECYRGIVIHAVSPLRNLGSHILKNIINSFATFIRKI